MSTFVQYTATAGQSTFNVPFPYLEPSHVKVRLGAFLLTLGTHFDFINASTIEIRPQFAPAVGTTVEVRRETPIEAALVQYQSGAVLSADDLNTAVRQQLYLTQEVRDLYEARLEAGLSRLTNGTAASAQQMIDAVVQDVLNSSLLTTLQQRITDIDANGEQIVQQSSVITDLQTQINALSTINGVGIATLIQNESNARIAGDQALAETIALIGARNGENTAFILDMSKVRVDSTTSLGTRLTGIDTAVSNANAAVASESTARSNADSALASQISALVSSVNGNTTAIQTQATTINGLSAQYTVKIDNNGRVSGFGLASTPVNGTPFSEFVVLANRFAIVDPGNPGETPRVPFAVSGGTVFMQNVVIGDALIQNLTLTKLTSGTLNANMNMGTGRIIFDNGSFLMAQGVGFGTSNQFVLWFGPRPPGGNLNLCSEVGARFYLRTNGTAYFGGAIAAGTLTMSGQSGNLANNADVTVQGTSNGGIITVAYSYSWFSARTIPPGGSSSMSGTPTATAVLSRQIGGAGFVDIATQNVSGSVFIENATSVDSGLEQEQMSGSWTFTDTAQTAQNRTYRLRLTARSVTGSVNPPYVTTQNLSIVASE